MAARIYKDKPGEPHVLHCPRSSPDIPRPKRPNQYDLDPLEWVLQSTFSDHKTIII